MNIGMVGLGRMGKKHLKALYNMKENDNIPNRINDIYIFDTNVKEMDELSKTYGAKPCSDLVHLREAADAIIISTPTNTHYEIASYFVEKNKDVFIEKPITFTMEESTEFFKKISQRDIICMVGHIEHFNPAVLYLKEYLKDKNIRSLSADRISKVEKGRLFDIDAVKDLMIHDIDIILSIVDCKTHKIAAVSTSEDLNNVFAIIQFENDITANLHVNRLAFERSRKLSIHTDEEEIHLDFINGTIDFLKPYIKSIVKSQRYSNDIIGTKETVYFNGDALKNELSHFLDCIETRTRPLSNEYTGGLALDIASQIVKNAIKKR